MSHKVGNVFNDYCAVVRCKDELSLYPRNHMQGVRLSDERMTILFNVYVQLLEEELNELRNQV